MSSNSKRRRQKATRRKITSERRSGVTNTKLGAAPSNPLPARTSSKQYTYTKVYPKKGARQQ